jgi:hypothetical protein
MKRGRLKITTKPSGQERAVFNVLELFEPSRFCTYEVSIAVESAEGLKELEHACELARVEIEDWTANIRNLCKACSEGRPWTYPVSVDR